MDKIKWDFDCFGLVIYMSTSVFLMCSITSGISNSFNWKILWVVFVEFIKSKIHVQDILESAPSNEKQHVSALTGSNETINQTELLVCWTRQIDTRLGLLVLARESNNTLPSLLTKLGSCAKCCSTCRESNFKNSMLLIQLWCFNSDKTAQNT